ncbi:BTB and MATH domain-containing protein 38 [Caenorhabditis elegans]|uniref:BTB and MATH domain-containing protein 38 n=1 Tax=Caenorhabditis elegans TaxID=6239 RepID=BAT38_CAEEL|nr:BTB and MATH domain-containing protein 38 [Caenorhabditis elegans]Q20681.1 RecName: Full=BTB and MATH domain-containing protein 38 [Caenorhabditis elegans]CAA91323.1 BTB and MATH domain-containing protein 38 [Caenorhabditis elegans]|eukprot:NP_496172.1 BTB and MATH domain-containing protein 38 [Caenorhabditis elegans]
MSEQYTTPERENPDDERAFDRVFDALSISCPCDNPSNIPNRLFASPPTQSAPEQIDNGAADVQPFDFQAYNQPRLARTEGMLKLEIPNFSNLRSKVSTPFQYIGNLPWRLAAKTEKTKRTSDVKFFSVYIDCNPESESTLWSCDAVVEFRLVSRNRTIPPFSRQFTNKFNYNSNNWGFPSFMAWEDVNNSNYVRNEMVTVTARVVVQKVLGVRNVPKYDFGAMQTNICDMTLVINKQKLFVNKAYLALYSPVFYAMFFSNFQEREKTQVELEDVVLEEFRELLHVIYPCHKPITSDNVEYLLELGDKYEIQYVMDECERFLVGSEDILQITKLMWADQYLLAKLQDSCLRNIKEVSDVKAIKLTEEFKNLSDATKAALLEKVLKIVN